MIQDPGGAVYALSLDGQAFRYVGMTHRGVTLRLKGHRQGANRGVRRPVYSWMRKCGPANVVATVLEVVPDGD